jgi:CRP-like cAMP-binding protein
MTSLTPILVEHPFFAGLDAAQLDLVVGCARNVRFDCDTYLFREGVEATDFYLLRHGRVAIELPVQRRSRVVSTMGPGEVLGWSWLIPPYHWTFAARAMELTRAIALDGTCLRQKCEADHGLGFELLKRFARDMETRLHGAWLQIIDVYGAETRR